MGHGFAALTVGVAAGCVVEAIGLWRLQDALQLSTMPGLSVLLKRAKRRRGGRVNGVGPGGPGQ
jgi:hypothetical protein